MSGDREEHPTLEGHPALEALKRAPVDTEPVSDEERKAVEEARRGAFTREPPFQTKLTPRERQLLLRLMEECAEVIQATSKLLCFGDRAYEGYANGMTNAEALAVELDDVRAVLAQLEPTRPVLRSCPDRIAKKTERLNRRIAESLELDP